MLRNKTIMRRFALPLALLRGRHRSGVLPLRSRRRRSRSRVFRPLSPLLGENVNECVSLSGGENQKDSDCRIIDMQSYQSSKAYNFFTLSALHLVNDFITIMARGGNGTAGGLFSPPSERARLGGKRAPGPEKTAIASDSSRPQLLIMVMMPRIISRLTGPVSGSVTAFFSKRHVSHHYYQALYLIKCHCDVTHGLISRPSPHLRRALSRSVREASGASGSFPPENSNACVVRHRIEPVPQARRDDYARFDLRESFSPWEKSTETAFFFRNLVRCEFSPRKLSPEGFLFRVYPRATRIIRTSPRNNAKAQSKPGAKSSANHCVIKRNTIKGMLIACKLTSTIG